MMTSFVSVPEADADLKGNHEYLRMLVQEEQKVAILRARLEEMGIDVDSLLEAVGDEENEPHEE